MTFGKGTPKGRRLESRDGLPVERSYQVQLIGGLAGALANAAGYFPEENWAEIEELRTCVDLSFTVPIAIATDTTAVLRVYAVVERVTALVQEVRFAKLASRISDDGRTATSIVRVKGAMPHAWKVTAATAATLETPLQGQLTMIAYGTGCADPFASGEDPSKGISPGPYPPVSALTLVFDSTSGAWIPGTKPASQAAINGAVGGIVAIKAGPTDLLTVSVANAQAGQFLMFFDQAIAPVDTDVPMWILDPTTNQQAFAVPLHFALASWFAWSSTIDTLTHVAARVGAVSLQYR